MNLVVGRVNRNAGGGAGGLGMASCATRITANPAEMIDGGVIGKVCPMAVGTSAGADRRAASGGGDGQQGACISVVA